MKTLKDVKVGDEILDEDEDVTELAQSKAKEQATKHYHNWINDKIERYGK